MIDIEEGFTPVQFGSRVKHYRYMAGLTQAKLATMVGLSTGRLTEIERGDFKNILPIVSKYGEKLVSALGCTMYTLTHRFNEPLTPPENTQ